MNANGNQLRCSYCRLEHNISCFAYKKDHSCMFYRCITIHYLYSYRMGMQTCPLPGLNKQILGSCYLFSFFIFFSLEYIFLFLLFLINNMTRSVSTMQITKITVFKWIMKISVWEMENYNLMMIIVATEQQQQQPRQQNE